VEAVLAVGDPTMLEFVVEVCAALGDRELCERVYARMSALEGRFAHGGMLGMTWDGPVDRALALLHAQLGRAEAAESCFARALASATEAGSRPQQAWVSYDYARFSLERSQTEHGLSLLASARQLGEELAMPALCEVIAALGENLAENPAGRAPSSSPKPALLPRTAEFRMRRDGELWLIECGPRSFRLKDGKGLRILAQLVGEPGREHHVLALVQPGGASDTGDAGDWLDPLAREQYRARVASLRAELADAEAGHDLGRAERSRAELDALSDQLARAVGLGGRARKSGAAVERARVNVQRRLRDAIRRIGAQEPELARHLEWAVKTGTFCRYEIH
jgi:hypothetical protein